MKNIQSSFKVVGVCPFDRSLVADYTSDTNESEQFSLFPPEVLARKAGLKCLPLYSPACSKTTSKSLSDLSIIHSDASFSDEESSDEFMLDSDVSFRETSVPPSNKASSISKFLEPPVPPQTFPTEKIL